MPPLTGRPRGDTRQWRSLVDDPARAAQEFPSLAVALSRPRSRRNVMQLMAASMALAGCDPGTPDGHLIPAVIAPPQIVAGLPNIYSTASTAGGSAIGITVEHQMGRPLKVEGNPNHPSSLGATDPFAQAMILDFYDPDRSGAILAKGNPVDRQSLEAALLDVRGRLGTSGAGLRILTGMVTSPSLGAAIDAVLARYPGARWTQWEPVSRDAIHRGAMLAYGRPVVALPQLAAADVVFALDSDLLSAAPGHVAHARAFASRRNPVRAAMSRVYAAEPTPTLTGAAADHRFVATPGELAEIVSALAASVLHGTPAAGPSWLAAIVADLQAHHGHALVHAGPDLPAEAHALIFAVNEALGARDTTMRLIDTPLYRPADGEAGIADLLEDMRGEKVDTLLVLDSNPAFAQPGFAQAMTRVKTSIVAAQYADETAVLADWHVPQAHAFECWGDARGHDGTACIMQPQALPLFGGRSPLQVLALLTGSSWIDTQQAVRAQWAKFLSDDAWNAALASGVIPGTASPSATVTLRTDLPQIDTPPAPPLTVLFRPDPHLWDGRHANNAWLQELPRPLTKLVWDNPILVSPALAAQHKLVNGAEIALRVGIEEVRAPIWIMPGQAPGCVTALLGWGRLVVGAVGVDTGFDFYPLRAASGAATLHVTGNQRSVASTDHHDVLAAGPGDIVRHGTLAEFTRDPHFAKPDEDGPGLYDRPPGGPVAWGMSIDLNACIGCNACVVACQAENNIPVVGKQNVMDEREMHWLRIDRYYQGDADAPESFFQPMLCMHCEQAPCEVVCPVEATVTDQEGLNTMVYNRCVGTRFCSNNCPYKVRRFNFGPYARDEHRPP
ncbi:4Fe-4S dicluster domain-containing protein, partial [Acidisphaera sp. L21]|uniref:4Fe-4S dicluster domain-containing protein n=1 Tax=Acidisphaera sp. L21 TaxID=1641851 RepID=UPI0020B117D8